jgi:hypothetical protein
MSFDAFGKLYEDAKRVLELRLFIWQSKIQNVYFANVI